MLERLVGSPLVIRTASPCKLTLLGEAYAEQVRQALATIANATLTAMGDPRANSLHLAIHPAFGSRWLMPRIAEFFAQHPAVPIKFITRYRQPVDFTTDDADAAIYFGEPFDEEITFDYLFRDSVVPVCSPAYLQANPVAEPADLLHARLLHEATRMPAWPEWFEANGVTGKVPEGLQLEQFSLVTHAALGGLGVALIPEFLIRSEIDRGELVVAVDRPLESSKAYYLIYPKYKSDHRPLRVFRGWIVREAEGKGGRTPAQRVVA
jgi:LysR family glycine cleavage system transcriptional activator